MINLKKYQYYQYQYPLLLKKDITNPKTGLVYGLIYDECVFKRPDNSNDGYCGIPNKVMAEKLGISENVLIKCFDELEEKGLIIRKIYRAKNGNRHKKIYINLDNYIADELPEPNQNAPNEKLLAEIEELKKEIESLRLENIKNAHVSNIGHELIRTGFITEKRYKVDSEELNAMLIDFNTWHRGGLETSRACFNYWQKHRAGKVTNYVGYIDKCIRDSKKWLEKEPMTADDFHEQIERMKKDFEKQQKTYKNG